MDIEVQHAHSFAEGFSGGPTIIAEVWPTMKAKLDGSALMSVAELAQSVKLLAVRQHLVVEGAGRVGAKKGEKICCVVSGGHIDADVLAEILCGVEEWDETDSAVAAAKL